MSQSEALEISMKLEASLIRDNSGMVQIQNQLDALIIQLEEIKKGK
jgi:hypothetical protein